MQKHILRTKYHVQISKNERYSHREYTHGFKATSTIEGTNDIEWSGSPHDLYGIVTEIWQQNETRSPNLEGLYIRHHTDFEIDDHRYELLISKKTVRSKNLDVRLIRFADGAYGKYDPANEIWDWTVPVESSVPVTA
jgi:hypothetical protein